MKQETPQQTVLRIEALRMKKGLKKGDVCRATGVLNSGYSYWLKRGIAGYELNEHHTKLFDDFVKNAQYKTLKRKSA